MRTVWKFAMQPQECTMVPVGKVIHVGPQQISDSAPQVWVELDPDEATMRRPLWLFGTGHDIRDDDLIHVGSAVCANGSLVWHVYAQRNDTRVAFA